MISKVFISILRDSAFFLRAAFIEILNQSKIALEAWASERSLSPKYPTSLCTTLIVICFGREIPSTACFKASKLEEPSAFKISLNSDIFDWSPAFNWAKNCCKAPSPFALVSFSLIKAILWLASFSLETTSTILPGSGNSVNPRIWTGSPPEIFEAFFQIQFCILLTLP